MSVVGMQDRWQATEMRKKELEKLEEKHLQMQALLTNLGSVMGTTVTAAPVVFQPTPAAAFSRTRDEEIHRVKITAPYPEPATAAPIEETATEASVSKPYQNLFNLPKQPDRHRQNFFD